MDDGQQMTASKAVDGGGRPGLLLFKNSDWKRLLKAAAAPVEESGNSYDDVVRNGYDYVVKRC